jgi:hypothetical protein
LHRRILQTQRIEISFGLPARFERSNGGWRFLGRRDQTRSKIFLGAPVEVVVFQWPWGTPARQRSPRNERPRNRAIFVESPFGGKTIHRIVFFSPHH